MFDHTTPPMRTARLVLIVLAMAALVPVDSAFGQTVWVRSGATLRVGTKTTIRTTGTLDFGDAGQTSRLEEINAGYVHAGSLRATRTIPALSGSEPAGLGFALTVQNEYTPLVERRHESVAVKGKPGIKRSYLVTGPHAPSSSGIAVAIRYADVELDLNADGNADFAEVDLSLFMYYDNGETAPKWVQVATSVDSGQNQLTASALTSIAQRWTAGVRLTATELIGVVRAEVEDSALKSGQAKKLKSGLDRASNSLANGNTEDAVAQLASVKDQIGVLSGSGALSAAAAESLVLETDSAIEEIRRMEAPGATTEGLAAAYAEEYIETIEISHSMADAFETVPDAITLQPAYPNPFNPSTTITFSLPEAGKVHLAVYDVLGRQVALLVDGEQTAGHHAVRFDADRLSSGAYFVRMNAGRFSQTQRITLLR